MRMGSAIALVASLMGEPARANMLASLLDGRALTASELAFAANVSPQTASGHLAKLLDGGLLSLERRGRYRHFRLADHRVAEILELVSGLADLAPPRHRPAGPRDAEMRAARTCYDHLAGAAAVAFAHTMLSEDLMLRRGADFVLTDPGEAFLRRDCGIDTGAVRAAKNRKFARCCLDWSERKPHIGGALGAALLTRWIADGWIERRRDTRAVRITPRGVAGFAALTAQRIPEAA